MNGDQIRRRLGSQATQARRDLSELATQVSIGEIDPETADRLRSRYQADLTSADKQLSALAGTTPPPRRSRSRSIATSAVLLVALAAAVGTASQLAQNREIGNTDGIPLELSSLDDISTETLEAVLAGYEADPELVASLGDQLLRMRFAAGERRFQEGRYDKAFEHYDTIIRSEPRSDLAAVAFSRIAWIVWVGNGETDLAMDLIERSLALIPDNPEALYLKGQLLWCGTGDSESASILFDRLLQDFELDDSVREQVEADLAVSSTGGGCE